MTTNENHTQTTNTARKFEKKKFYEAKMRKSQGNHNWNNSYIGLD